MYTPNLEQTFRNMIEAAVVGAGFYGLLAESTRDVQAKAFLEGLVARERANGEALEIMALDMTNRALPPHADHNLDMSKTAPEWRFVDDISYDQAVEVAVDAASHSALIYSALADGTPEPARGVLSTFADQQEAHVAQLIGLRKAKSPMWDFRRFARTDLRQSLRNGIAAEIAAARFHTSMIPRAEDRPTRIYLEQLALDENASATELEIVVLERFDGTLPTEADPHANTIKLPQGLDLPNPLSLAAVLEHALVLQTLGARYYRVLASLSTGALAEAMDGFASQQEEHMAALVARRNTYWMTHADDVKTVPPEDLAKIMRRFS
jgi:rubrerythrin